MDTINSSSPLPPEVLGGRDGWRGEIAATLREWHADRALWNRLSEGAAARALELAEQSFGEALRDAQREAITQGQVEEATVNADAKAVEARQPAAALTA